MQYIDGKYIYPYCENIYPSNAEVLDNGNFRYEWKYSYNVKDKADKVAFIGEYDRYLNIVKVIENHITNEDTEHIE